MADKKDIMKMLNEELGKKVDSETLEKLKGAKTKKEGLAILEKMSIKLDDDMLDAVSGGDDVDPENCDRLCWERDVCSGDSCFIVVCTEDDN